MDRPRLSLHARQLRAKGADVIRAFFRWLFSRRAGGVITFASDIPAHHRRDREAQ
jgi:hypothetical protein